jgi:hypothetical protein
MTVENLRKSGWKVRVLHYRSDESCEGKIKSSHSKECKVNPKGGKTVVILDSPTGDHFEGLAVCSSDDLYNKKIGVKIAIGRALFSNNDKIKSLNLSRKLAAADLLYSSVSIGRQAIHRCRSETH